MATHYLNLQWEVLFEDGSVWPLEFRKCYGFFEQKGKYLVNWLEQLIEENKITSKPVSIRESYKVVECEPYKNIIGM